MVRPQYPDYQTNRTPRPRIWGSAQRKNPLTPHVGRIKSKEVQHGLEYKEFSVS